MIRRLFVPGFPHKPVRVTTGTQFGALPSLATGKIRIQRPSPLASIGPLRASGGMAKAEGSWRIHEGRLWSKAEILSELMRYGTLPADHPVSLELNRRSQLLREAARTDPLLREAGIQLSPHFRTTIFHAEVPSAFTLSGFDDACYISTGRLALAKDFGEVTSVLGHEQAHHIQHEYQRLSREGKGESKHRYGEPIWKDPYIEAAAEISPTELGRTLRSQVSELWCDTFGNFPYLAAIGVDPLERTRANQSIFSYEMANWVEDEIFGQRLDRVSALLRSHPNTLHRLWVSDFLARRLNFPPTLLSVQGKDLPLSKILTVPSSTQRILDLLTRDTAVADWFLTLIVDPHEVGKLFFDIKEMERAEKRRARRHQQEVKQGITEIDEEEEELPDLEERIYSLTDIPPTYLLPLRKGAEQAFPDTFQESLDKFSTGERIGLAVFVQSLLAAQDIFKDNMRGGGDATNLFGEEDDDDEEGPLTETVLSAQQRMVAGLVRGKRLTRKDEQRFQGMVANVMNTSGRMENDEFLRRSLRKVLPVLVPDALTRAFVKGIFSYRKNQSLHARSFPALSPRALLHVHRSIPHIAFDPTEIATKFLLFLQTNQFAFIGLKKSRGEKGAAPYAPEKHAVHYTPSFEAFLFEWEEILQRSFEMLPAVVNDFVLERVFTLCRRSAFGERVDFISWLREFERIDHENITPIGPLATQENLLSMGLGFAFLSGDASDEAIAQRLEALAAADLREGLTYAQIKNPRREIPSKTLLREALPDPFSRAFAVLRRHWPLLADRLLWEKMAPKGIEDWRPGAGDGALLRELSEPTFLVLDRPKVEGGILTVKRVTNLHDRFAAVIPEVERQNETMSAYLQRLETFPHRFSASVWVNLARKAIQTLEDLEILAPFIDHALVSPAGQTLPWLERNRMEASIDLVEFSLTHLALNAESSDIRERVAKLLQQLPRHSRRNRALLPWLRRLCALSSPPLQEICDLAKLVETEPHEEMLQELMEEISHHKDAKMVKLEEKIESAQKGFVPEDVWDRDERERKNLIDVGFKLHSRFKGQKVLAGKDSILVIEGAWINSDLVDATYTISTPTIQRFQLYEAISKEKAAPKEPLPLLSRSIQEAENLAPLLLRVLGLRDPLAEPGCFGSEEVGTGEAFWRYFDRVIVTCQPVPTSLRDRWIRRACDDFEAKGGRLGAQDLERLQREAYLPETVEFLGLKLWKTRKNSLSGVELIRAIQTILPYYSLQRNEVLKEARRLLGGYTYEEARQISSLLWLPGMPTPKPIERNLGASSMVEFLTLLMESFEDLDKVEFIFWLYGVIETKPWSVAYTEYLLGKTLSEVRESSNDLDASVRRALIHRIFSGNQGIFAQDDVTAHRCLSREIAKMLAAKMNADATLRAFMEDLCLDIFWRAGFSAQVRSEILAVLVDWTTEMKREATVDDEKIADLISRGFCAVGSAGMRLLQALLIEPKVFPDSLRRHLRRVQDLAEPGDPMLPFHLATAQETHDLRLVRDRGGGSMAEIHETDEKGSLGKFTRPDTLGVLRLIETSLQEVAETIARYGYGWSKQLISSIVESCQREIDLTREAEMTGKPMAEIIAEALRAEGLPPWNGNARLQVRAGQSGKPLEMVIPVRRPKYKGQAVDRKGKYPFLFMLTDLSAEMETFAAMERKRGERSLQAYVAAKGLALEQIAANMVRLFLNAFLNGKLLLDLHYGNVGVISPARGEKPKVALLDFGSVIVDFPAVWRLWIFRFLVHGLFGQREELRRDLLECALVARGPEALHREVSLQKNLEKLLDRVAETVHALVPKEATVSEALQDLFEFLYQEWPLPPDLRNFAEGLRKVFREWIPHVPRPELVAIQSELRQRIEAIPLSELTQRPLAHESLIQEFLERQEILLPEGQHRLAQKGDDLVWFHGHPRLPKEAIVHFWQEDQGTWVEAALQEPMDIEVLKIYEYPRGTFGVHLTLRQGANIFGLTVRKDSKGYFEIRKGEEKHLLSFQHLYQWVEAG